MSFTFAQVFLSALVFYFVVQSLVCWLEIAHLHRTKDKVPEELAHKVTLAQHRKAHHYDIARTWLNWFEVTLTSALIWGLTSGNGINVITDWLMDHVGDQFAFHWMLPTLVGLIFVALDLPFSWMREFRLREAYGYTRERPRKWFHTFMLETILGWIAILPLLWILLFLWRHTDQSWWIFGWLLYSVYLIFSLRLSGRLVYVLQKKRASDLERPDILDALARLAKSTGARFSRVALAAPEDKAHLPPAFAFGAQSSLQLFFRHDVIEKLNAEELAAIAAHAVARNRSHMYFQAWLMSSLVGLGVFMFLGWFAPQSWFMEEIGLRVYGPGPYYGSLFTFAIVALPVLLFPLKYPMDAFLRHLIYKSDTYALKHTNVETLTGALVDLLPNPIRHSTLTLGIFDLLFSHEPSLMARIKEARKNAALWVSAQAAARERLQASRMKRQKATAASALRIVDWEKTRVEILETMYPSPAPEPKTPLASNAQEAREMRLKRLALKAAVAATPKHHEDAKQGLTAWEAFVDSLRQCYEGWLRFKSEEKVRRRLMDVMNERDNAEYAHQNAEFEAREAAERTVIVEDDPKLSEAESAPVADATTEDSPQEENAVDNVAGKEVVEAPVVEAEQAAQEVTPKQVEPSAEIESESEVASELAAQVEVPTQTTETSDKALAQTPAPEATSEEAPEATETKPQESSDEEAHDKENNPVPEATKHA